MDKRPGPYTILEKGWILRVQAPVAPGSNRVLLMLHGWTGDEIVMSVFGQKAASNYWLISPRGPIRTSTTGFGWLPIDSNRHAEYSNYVPVVDDLDRQLTNWLAFLKIHASNIDLMGFSQGGAIALSYLIHHPDRIQRAACLAGFLPPGAESALDQARLIGKKVLIAHGANDETIPIRMATQSAQLLKAAGAEVTFCQDNVGHKLGPTCFNGLEDFFYLKI